MYKLYKALEYESFFLEICRLGERQTYILKNDQSVAIAGLRNLERVRGTCSLSQTLYLMEDG